jgi:hypothetical protein
MRELIIRSSRPDHLAAYLAERRAVDHGEPPDLLTTNFTSDLVDQRLSFGTIHRIDASHLRWEIISQAMRRELAAIRYQRIVILHGEAAEESYLPIYRLARRISRRAEMVVDYRRGVRRVYRNGLHLLAARLVLTAVERGADRAGRLGAAVIRMLQR